MSSTDTLSIDRALGQPSLPAAWLSLSSARKPSGVARGASARQQGRDAARGGFCAGVVFDTTKIDRDKLLQNLGSTRPLNRHQ